MKNSVEHARALGRLLGKLSRYSTEHKADELDSVGQLIHGFWAYDCTHARSGAAYRSMMGHFVDLNDLRVSDPAEVVSVVGDGYPQAYDRAIRMRQALNAVYKREHAVDLTRLKEKPKKEVRDYLDTLDGMVPYVSAVVTLLGFGGHGVPLDNQLFQKLKEDGVIERDATIEEAGAFLESHVSASDAVEAHKRLRAYVERRVKFTPPKPKAASTKGKGKGRVSKKQG